MNMIDEVMRNAGSAGMVRSAVIRKPDAEDYIRGYFDTDDVGYGLRMLISQFEVRKQAQKFKVGDRVRVKRKFWYLGNQRNGWQGYTPMFADAIGTVAEVTWSTSQERWYLLVQYDDPYSYSDYLGGDFHVQERSASFMFNLNAVKKAKS